MLSPEAIEKVRDDFVTLLFDRDRASDLFYRSVFEAAPETRALFQRDLVEQGRALMATLARIVAGLERLESMVPTLSELAIRHIGYGVELQHYDIVEGALLGMVEEVCGTCPRSAEAWRMAYSRISRIMMEAAYGSGGPNSGSRHHSAAP